MEDNSEAPDLVETSNPVQSSSNRLASLIAAATAAYAVKNYSSAAELYSQATELQAEINGEMAIENADLLYLYGRCLYHVAVRNSDVLGGSAAGAKLGAGASGEEREKKKRKLDGGSSKKEPRATHTFAEVKETMSISNILDEDPSSASASETKAQPAETEDQPSGKPLFQFQGDENWDNDSDEEEDGDDEPEEEEDDDDDDFVNAFEVLDLARILLLRKLEALQTSALETDDKGKDIASIDMNPEVRQVKERVADVHDLQSEISLEAEKFTNAVEDLRSSLMLKKELFPPESEILAECYYKLSISLECASVTQQHDKDGNPVGEAVVDKAMRDEAATQMEKAIASCRLRILKEEKQVEELEAGPEKTKLVKNVEDVREMVTDMETRLLELQKPPLNVAEASRLELDSNMKGILSQILGESKEQQIAKLQEVTVGANDLTGLVKRKKPKTTSNGASTAATPEPTALSERTNGIGRPNGTGKRKVELADETQGLDTGIKRTKVEDADDSGL